MLPEGNYKGTIRDWGMGTSSKKGTPYFFIEANLAQIEDEETGNYQDLERTFRRSVQMYLSGGAMSISAASIRSLGFKDTNFDRLHPDHPEAHSFAGHEVFLHCQHEEDEDGKTREKWSIIRKQPKASLAEVSALDGVKALFAAEQTKAAAKFNPDEASHDEAPTRRRRGRTAPAEAS